MGRLCQLIKGENALANYEDLGVNAHAMLAASEEEYKKAMAELQKQNGSDTAGDEMVIFVVMNTASMQLLPTMLGSLRQSYGSNAPFEIIVPVWLSSGCALAVALIIALSGNKFSKRIR